MRMKDNVVQPKTFEVQAAPVAFEESNAVTASLIEDEIKKQDPPQDVADEAIAKHTKKGKHKEGDGRQNV